MGFTSRSSRIRVDWVAWGTGVAGVLLVQVAPTTAGPARKGVSRYGGFLEYVRLAFGGRREEQVRPRESNGPSLEPRGFGKPSPTYPAPSNIYCSCSSCPYNPLPTYKFSKWLCYSSLWSMSLSDLRGLVLVLIIFRERRMISSFFL